jgi:predicted Fe-Mo cluster-binding NifX family protein
MLNSELDPRFGRARYFVVVDTDTGEVTAHDNGANLQAVQGDGIQAAQDVIQLGADAVITGNIGPKATRALAVGHVQTYQRTWGTVKDAVEHLKSGLR